jgi:glycosyltransferase involved in cell wall biosynthesis
MPKVSIILPTYNCAKYLPESIPSALSQTFRDFELLIIDDGSTDNTKNVIDENYKDPRIRYIRQEHAGLAAARNNGLDHSTGEYIAFLDADDLFLKSKIEKQLLVFEKSKSAGVVYTGEKYFLEDDKDILFDSPHPKFSGDVLVFLKRSNFMPVTTIMIKREIIGDMRFDVSLKSHEDWDFLLKLSAKRIMFNYLPEPLTLIRARKSSMTIESDVMLESRVIVGERARKIWKGLKYGKNIFSMDGCRSLSRYAALLIRARLLDFPDAPRFNKPTLFKGMKDSMPKLIFGTSVHVEFDSFLDLYKGVQKFFGEPLYIYASNEELGKPFGNLVKVEAKRNYKWRRSHHFLFDAFEFLKNRDYDYFVSMDSDCLVCSDALLAFLRPKDFDFVIYPNLDGLGWWYHGKIFSENINSYLDILKSIGLKRPDEKIVGNFNPLIILSRKAVEFLRERIEKIESADGYKALMALEFSVGETLIYNILKDAGLKAKFIDPDLKRGIRYRPYWEVDEYQKGVSIYHPVRRKKKDLFRRLIGIKAGYDRSYIFLSVIYMYKAYLKVRRLLGVKDTKKEAERQKEASLNP